MIVHLPEFYVIGAKHRGITWLAQLLGANKNVALNKQLNMNYFANDMHFNKGIEHFYAEFSEAKIHNLKGEIAPDYLFHSNKVIPRLKALYNGDSDRLKFIVYLKSPVNRLLDEYLINQEHGLEPLGILDALKREKNLLQNKSFLAGGNTLGLYKNNSLYYRQLKKWLEHYDLNQFFFITDIELSRSPKEVIKNLFRFLGINHNGSAIANNHRSHLGNPFSGILHVNRNLREFFPEIRRNKKPDINIPGSVYDQISKDVQKLSCLINNSLVEWEESIFSRV